MSALPTMDTRLFNLSIFFMKFFSCFMACQIYSSFTLTPIIFPISAIPSFIEAATYSTRSLISSSFSPKCVSCGKRVTIYFQSLLQLASMNSSVLGASSQVCPQLQTTSGLRITDLQLRPIRVLLSPQCLHPQLIPASFSACPMNGFVMKRTEEKTVDMIRYGYPT